MFFGCSISNLYIKKGEKFEFKITNDFVLDGRYKKIPIVGRSGTGKSSLFSAIFGLEPIESGTVGWTFPNGESLYIKSGDISQLEDIRKKYFGFAFQSSTLFDYLSVEENLLFPLLQIGKSKNEAKQIINKEIKKYLIEKEKGEDILKQFPSELSGGQKQRISLFQSIIHNPYIVLADEPTGSLDRDTRKQIMEILYEWVDEQDDRLVIWITHHEDDITLSKAPYTLRIGNGTGYWENNSNALTKKIFGIVNPYF